MDREDEDEQGMGEDEQGKGEEEQRKGKDEQGKGKDEQGKNEDEQGKGEDEQGKGEDERGRARTSRGKGEDEQGEGQRRAGERQGRARDGQGRAVEGQSGGSAWPQEHGFQGFQHCSSTPLSKTSSSLVAPKRQQRATSAGDLQHAATLLSTPGGTWQSVVKVLIKAEWTAKAQFLCCAVRACVRA